MTGRWVDEQTVEVAPKGTWATLSLDGLITLRGQLFDKQMIVARHPTMRAQFDQLLAEVDELMAIKLN